MISIRFHRYYRRFSSRFVTSPHSVKISLTVHFLQFGHPRIECLAPLHRAGGCLDTRTTASRKYGPGHGCRGSKGNGPPRARSPTASNFTDRSGRKRHNRASRRPQLILENADAVGLTHVLSFFTRSSCIPHATRTGSPPCSEPEAEASRQPGRLSCHMQLARRRRDKGGHAVHTRSWPRQVMVCLRQHLIR